jgi:archaellum biogenesis ATPase FlaH
MDQAVSEQSFKASAKRRRYQPRGGVMFKQSSSRISGELERRRKNQGERMSFGVDFLDDSLRGILRDDLVLIGAPSGMGKTQLCCNIANANLALGKKVHYVALEASEDEIERRLLYPLVMERYFSDPNRKALHVTFPEWLLGEHIDALMEYELAAARFYETAYGSLFTFYKQERFGLSELIQSVLMASRDTDLIMIDHVHYFDFDDDNENRAIREIAKTVRQLAIDEKVPIILVAHLRKRDRANEELCAGLEEFHGSSDLYKIATKVITMSPGAPINKSLFETYFRVPKNRIDGGVTRYLAKEFYNHQLGTYEKNKYRLGQAHQKRNKPFEEIDGNNRPAWAKRHGRGDDYVSARKPRFVSDQEGARLV